MSSSMTSNRLNGMSEWSLRETSRLGLPHSRMSKSIPRSTRSAAILGTALVCAAVAVAVTVNQRPITAPLMATADFDGRYAGRLVTASAGETGACARRAAAIDLVVDSGRALVSIGNYGPALHGRMQPGGQALLKGATDGIAVMTGRLQAGRFTGELQGWGCSYSVDLVAQH